MGTLRTGATTALRHVVYALLFGAIALHPRPAAAEKVLANFDGWEVYTDGRVAGFVSFAYGDGYPQADYGRDAANNFVTTPVDACPRKAAGSAASAARGWWRIRVSPVVCRSPTRGRSTSGACAAA